ncbi:MAG: orotidine-5'-phosphate decarboxylase [Gammaproteobacteria bacterium]
MNLNRPSSASANPSASANLSACANLSASDRLIVALDVDTASEADRLVDDLGDTVSFYKVGWQLFMREGLAYVQRLIGERKKRVFLDVKFEEIPRTVEESVRNVAREGTHFFTITGNSEAVRAAIAGRDGHSLPHFLYLTFLSSLDENDLRALTGGAGTGLETFIGNRARMAREQGVEGFIASGESVAWLRRDAALEGAIIVTPGIRPAGESVNDHKRALSPAQAIQSGADYLVVGRPVHKAANPRAVATQIIDDIDNALG